MDEVIDEQISGIGTGAHEMCPNVESFITSITRESQEWDGAFIIKDQWYQATELSKSLFLVIGELAVKENGGDGILYDMRFRFTMVLRKTATGWKLLHVHQSVPDANQARDEFFPHRMVEELSLIHISFALAFRNVYTFGPTFRAENSYTARHASEFWMIEPEIAFADLEDNMELAEAMVKYIINYVLEHAPEEMEFFNKFMEKGLLERLDNIVNSDFGRVTYTEAVELLKKSGKEFQYPVEWGIDLQTEHERYLTEEIFKKPLFVTDYPKEIKAFYMRLNEDNKTVAACDLLVPGVGEIIGGSQREERLDVLTQRMAELDLDEKDYWWYLDLRKYGGVKHAGYGLGLERIVLYITGMGNIRDVLPFPRTPKTAEF